MGFIAVAFLYANAEEAGSPQKRLLEGLVGDGKIEMLIELAKRDPRSFIEAQAETRDDTIVRNAEETNLEAVKDHKFKEIYKRILEYGRTKGSFTAGDIMLEQGVSRRTAKSRLAELQALGLVIVKETPPGRETVYTLKG